MLHELLLVLAGYPTSLEPKDFGHPAEYAIFMRAADFGAQLRAVMDVCADSGDALAGALQAHVEDPVLDSVVAAERKALSGKSSLIEIMADTAIRYAGLVDYAVELLNLAEIGDPRGVLRRKLAHDRLYSPYKMVSHACLEALDAAWLHELEPLVLWGPRMLTRGDPLGVQSDSNIYHQTVTSENNSDALRISTPSNSRSSHNMAINNETELIERIVAHPALTPNASTALQKTLDCLARLDLYGRLAEHSTAIQAMGDGEDSLFDKLGHNQDVIRSVTAPLVNVEELEHKITSIWLHTRTIALQVVASHDRVLSLVEVLRSIVLFGSGMFILGVAENAKRPLLALSQAEPDLSPSAVSVAEDILAWPGESRHLALNIRWPLEFVVDATKHVHIYVAIHHFLATVVVAKSALGVGTGEASIRNAAILNTLWHWFQSRCDYAMHELSVLVQSHTDIMDSHTAILENLEADLLLDDVGSEAMQRILDASYRGKVEDEALDTILRQLVVRGAHWVVAALGQKPHSAL